MRPLGLCLAFVLLGVPAPLPALDANDGVRTAVQRSQRAIFERILVNGNRWVI